MNIRELEAFVKLAVQYRVKRLTWGDTTVELDSTSLAPQAAALPASEDEVPVVCRCGHDASEHSDCGCLLGCPVSVCAPTPEE